MPDRVPATTPGSERPGGSTRNQDRAGPTDRLAGAWLVIVAILVLGATAPLWWPGAAPLVGWLAAAAAVALGLATAVLVRRKVGQSQASMRALDGRADRDDQGGFAGYEGVGRDVTEQRLAFLTGRPMPSGPTTGPTSRRTGHSRASITRRGPRTGNHDATHRCRGGRPALGGAARGGRDRVRISNLHGQRCRTLQAVCRAARG